MPHLLRADVDGLTLAVEVWPALADRHVPVVLLPATGETAEDWAEVAAVLARSRTVFAVNLRGHGPSDWPGTYSTRLFTADVAALLPQLSASPVDVVAHSLGGLVACAVAAGRPHLVRRVVLEDVGLLQPRRPSARRRSSWPADRAAPCPRIRWPTSPAPFATARSSPSTPVTSCTRPGRRTSSARC